MRVRCVCVGCVCGVLCQGPRVAEWASGLAVSRSGLTALSQHAVRRRHIALALWTGWRQDGRRERNEGGNGERESEKGGKREERVKEEKC